MKSQNHLWAIQTKLRDTGKKYLVWNYRGGKNLYWTSDKKAPAPLIFETRAEAIQAIKRSNKSKEKMPVDLFENVYDTAGVGKPVKVKIQVLN